MKGWFSDVDREAISPFVWQPCFDTDLGHIPSFQLWFENKEACDKWIRENVLDAKMLEDA